ncbi:DUF4293 domain-containing protein [Mucilaginibacter sp. KACC 22063]|uniref:DUF4293 domain-containing protein n=1 Tax=Mucilaginibacter sp. KACC 22063 TaxID=3025666 RepID=UPI0023657A34|nr:DUF4293 domain-containing protein [Mucilaginibacter sp. KACC 22063]WDF56405.1 DUF4293 domain-containing protein [Mucilaginibacter sp. KACC 22063]
MIQRIQTVYLLFAALVIFSLYLFPLAHDVLIDGIPSTIKVTGIYQTINGQVANKASFVALTAVTALVGLIPLVIIFLFRNRKQQVALCYSAILVIIGFSFWVAQTVKNATGGVVLSTNNMGIGIFLSSISIVLLILAAKSINKDEKLVRSADRLR